MKTVIALSLCGVCLVACNRQKANQQQQEPVGETRTTSAIVVQPTLHDGHAAEPNAPAATPEDQEQQSSQPQNDLTDQPIDRGDQPLEQNEQEPLQEMRDGG